MTNVGHSLALTGRPAGIEQIMARLERVSGEGRETVSIPATGPDGFAIVLWYDVHGIRACFGGLEQDFDTLQGATAWIERAVSGEYRLRIDFVGKRPVKWTLERADGAPDGDQLSFGYVVLFAAFMKRRTVYLQNKPTARLLLVGGTS